MFFLTLEDNSVVELPDDSTFFIGSNESCDLQRCLPGVKEYHITIHRTDEHRWIIADLGKRSYYFIEVGQVIESTCGKFIFNYAD